MVSFCHIHAPLFPSHKQPVHGDLSFVGAADVARAAMHWVNAVHGTCLCPKDLAAREGLKCPCQQQNPVLHLPSHSSLTVPRPEKEQEKCHGEGKRKHQKTTEGSCLEGTTPYPVWNFQQGCKNQSLFHIRDVNERHTHKGPDHRFALLTLKWDQDGQTLPSCSTLSSREQPCCCCCFPCAPSTAARCQCILVGCVDGDRAPAVNTEPSAAPGTGMGADTSSSSAVKEVFGTISPKVCLGAVLVGLSHHGSLSTHWQCHTENCVRAAGWCTLNLCCLTLPIFGLFLAIFNSTKFHWEKMPSGPLSPSLSL